MDAGTLPGVTNVVGSGTVGESMKMRAGKGGAGAGVGESSVVNINGNTTNNNLTAVKKPRVRPALAYANIVPSGRASGSSSRSGSGGSNNGGGNNSGGGKSNVNVQALGHGVVTRRSSRLLSGAGFGGGGAAGAGKVGLKVCWFYSLEYF